MSVNSVLPGLPPSYGTLSGSNSQTAKPAAFAKELPEKTFATPTGNGDPTDDGHFQSELDEALRAAGATAGRTASGTSESSSGQTSAAIALYKRVSQIGNDEPSA